MKVGLYCNSFKWDGGDSEIASRLRTLATESEKAGFDSFWVMDHFFQLPRHGAIDDPMLEAYSALNWLAGITNRMQLGAMVTGVTYRLPGVLINAATTLDVLADGRSTLGLGAAWFDREHEGLGIPFPPLAERFERLEETLQIAHHMWSGKAEPYVGKHYQLTEPLLRPQPVHRPHPPILVGGRGERKTLRLVAKYGDACNFSIFDHTPNLSAPSALDEVEHKLTVLRDHCQNEGRDYAEIERTVLGWLPIRESPGPDEFSVDQAVGVLSAYADLGIDHLIIATSTFLPAGYEPDLFELLREEFIPRARDIQSEGRFA